MPHLFDILILAFIAIEITAHEVHIVVTGIKLHEVVCRLIGIAAGRIGIKTLLNSTLADDIPQARKSPCPTRTTHRSSRATGEK